MGAAEVTAEVRRTTDAEQARHTMLDRVLSRDQVDPEVVEQRRQAAWRAHAPGRIPTLEAAALEASHGAARLALARHFAVTVEQLAVWRTAAAAFRTTATQIDDALERDAARPAQVAALDGEGDVDLLAQPLLDAVLDRAGVTTGAFLSHAQLGSEDLRAMTPQRLRTRVRDFAGARLDLEVPNLARALGGPAGDDVMVMRAMRRCLLRFHPPCVVDSDINAAGATPSGPGPRYQVQARLGDDSVAAALTVACRDLDVATVDLIEGPPGPHLRLLVSVGAPSLTFLATRLAAVAAASDSPDRAANALLPNLVD